MCAKEGVGLGSLAVSYIATPDGLLWTKGASFYGGLTTILLAYSDTVGCVAFQRDFSVT